MNRFGRIEKKKENAIKGGRKVFWWYGIQREETRKDTEGSVGVKSLCVDEFIIFNQNVNQNMSTKDSEAVAMWGKI